MSTTNVNDSDVVTCDTRKIRKAKTHKNLLEIGNDFYLFPRNIGI